MGWLSIKAEFTVANLRLDYERPSDFVEPVCRVCSLWFICYRVASALYFWGVLPYAAIAQLSPKPRLLATVSYWTYIVQCVTTLLQACTAAHHHYVAANGNRGGFKRMPIIYRVQWVLNNMVMVAAPMLTAIYWIILYKGQEVTVSNATIHGVSAISVLLDRCVTASPVRLLHVWHSMLYGAVYAIFTAIHFAAGGATIYPFLDYSEAPGTAVAFLVCLAFLAAPFAHILMYLLTVSREAVWECCKAHNRKKKKLRSNKGIRRTNSHS